mmetsp:Transcript_67183/g.174937  ORF Transcript_67183/g.174937 Transcript_67183/m.174937 type:complete len:220 (+) Transcript_67183:149-808(+)
MVRDCRRRGSCANPTRPAASSPDCLLPHVLQERGVGDDDRVPVQLVRGGEAPVLRGPRARGVGGPIGRARARDQRHRADDLVGPEAARLSDCHERVEHEFLCLLRLAEVLDALVLHAVRLGPFLELMGIRLHECNRPIHVAVAVAHDATVNAVDIRRGAILFLHGLYGDVLATLELHEVLHAVHDHKGPICGQHAHITRMKPPFLVKDLGSFVRLLEVA